MNEEEAKEYLDVPRETLERLDAFVALLRSDSERQNLVSKASLEEVWTRHIADSLNWYNWYPKVPEHGWTSALVRAFPD
jgi:16S rRNA (guanine527-N7)-methyltransferase